MSEEAANLPKAFLWRQKPLCKRRPLIGHRALHVRLASWPRGILEASLWPQKLLCKRGPLIFSRPPFGVKHLYVRGGR